MRIDILTIFPEMFIGPFSYSIIKRAQEKGIAEIHIHNIRDFARNKHKNVDDYGFGGDAGMVMMIQPIADCIEHLKSEREYDEIIFLTPDGLLLDLQRILKASSVGAQVYEKLVPLSRQAGSFNKAVSEGEDFELLFTMSPKEAIRAAKMRLRSPVSLIGRIIERKK